MFNHELILNHIDDIFGQDMHAKVTVHPDGIDRKK